MIDEGNTGVCDSCYRDKKRVSYPLTLGKHIHCELANQGLSGRLAFEIRHVRANDIELYVTGEHVETCDSKPLGAYTRTRKGNTWTVQDAQR
jgi:hypothetical protein